MRLIPVVPVTRVAIEGLLQKARAGLVQKKIWVQDSTGRKGHYRLAWVKPENDNAHGASQAGLFDDSGNANEAAIPKKEPKQKKKKSSDYEIYHNSLTSAINEVIYRIDEEGFYLSENDVFHDISSGPKKPSEGKTNRYSMPLFNAEGKPAKKAIHFQVYGMGNGRYELNMYFSPMSEKDYTEDEVQIRKPENRQREAWELYEELDRKRKVKYGDPEHERVVLSIGGKKYVVDGYAGDMLTPGSHFYISPIDGGKVINYPGDVTGEIETIETIKQKNLTKKTDNTEGESTKKLPEPIDIADLKAEPLAILEFYINRGEPMTRFEKDTFNQVFNHLERRGGGVPKELKKRWDEANYDNAKTELIKESDIKPGDVIQDGKTVRRVKEVKNSDNTKQYGMPNDRRTFIFEDGSSREIALFPSDRVDEVRRFKTESKAKESGKIKKTGKWYENTTLPNQDTSGPTKTVEATMRRMLEASAGTLASYAGSTEYADIDKFRDDAVQWAWENNKIGPHLQIFDEYAKSKGLKKSVLSAFRYGLSKALFGGE